MAILGASDYQVKHCLNKTLAKTSLDFRKLQTELSQIELILNLRPLGVLFDDDLEQIQTPNQYRVYPITS